MAIEKSEYEELSKDVAYDLEKFKDPYVVGAMIHRLVEERKLTNALLKQISERLDALEGKGKRDNTQDELSDTDLGVLEFVKENKKVCAEEVQEHFKYRGKNAASARLNALFKQDVLKKHRAGKKVFFSLT